MTMAVSTLTGWPITVVEQTSQRVGEHQHRHWASVPGRYLTSCAPNGEGPWVGFLRMKATQRFTVRPALPDALAGLSRLAGNLRWSWHRRTRDLFAWADAAAWHTSNGDPVAAL